MRWQVPKPEPVIRHRDGDIRVTEKFLYFPLTLPVGGPNGCLEGRWWEKVKVTQKFSESAGWNVEYQCWWSDLYFAE